MTGHTVGPWRAWKGMVLSEQDGGEVVVASDIPSADDATLIASAPDLLDALKEAREWIGEPDWFLVSPDLIARIDSAIAAATRET